MNIEDLDASRTLKQPANIAARQSMLHAPHLAPLTAYVESLRAHHPGWEYPDFDPLDGGINADMLFLLEKPGPMTSPKTKRKGSGFISRNNDDATAEAIFQFMRQAEIERGRVILWNVIPGWNETIKIKAGERREGLEALAGLMKLLPKVKTVVLVGRHAGKAAGLMRTMGLRVFMSAHPSPKVRSTNRALWDQIPGQWAAAARI